MPVKIQKLLSRHGLPLDVLDISAWPDITLSQLSQSAIERYTYFKRAITLVIRDKHSISQAARETGVDRSELDRVLERCFETANDGQIEGFRALIPYRRLKPVVRNPNSGSTAGLLESLMDKFPDINTTLWEGYKKGESIEQLKKLLLEELLPAKNYPTHLYPYNTVTQGREALRIYLKRYENKRVSEEWIEQGYHEKRDIIVRPFERVELDAHRCDAHFVIHLEGPEGLSRTLVLERIWILVLLDVASRAELGYALCFNRQVSISDVLEAIHCAIVPQPKPELTIPGLEYKPGAGYPNQLIPVCAWQLFDLIAMDNAMAQRSGRLHQILNDNIDCTIKLNRAKTPNDNPYIERFFATLTAHGMKRTPSTTGSGPDDPRRDHPEEKAEYFEFTVDEGHQVLNVLGANYNIESHRGIYTSPIEYLRTYYKEASPIIRAVPNSQRDTWTLRQLWVEVTVRGHIRKGNRPYIQYLDAHYRSDLLNVCATLIGSKMLLLLNIDDLRAVQAFYADGRFFGVLQVCGRWALTKHSLKTRQLIIKLSREKELCIGYRDPIRALNLYLEEKAKSNKWARNQLLRLRQEADQEANNTSDTDDVQNPHSLAPYQPLHLNWIALDEPIYD